MCGYVCGGVLADKPSIEVVVGEGEVVTECLGQHVFEKEKLCTILLLL